MQSYTGKKEKHKGVTRNPRRIARHSRISNHFYPGSPATTKYPPSLARHAHTFATSLLEDVAFCLIPPLE